MSTLRRWWHYNFESASNEAEQQRRDEHTMLVIAIGAGLATLIIGTIIVVSIAGAIW